MSSQKLIDTARMLVAGDKGLLAMDESNSTCNKRFARLGIPQTEEARRAYRELIVTTPKLGEFISGAILYDETIRQNKKDGVSFLNVLTDAGIIPGIKVDTGAKDMAGHPGEKITEGLDDCVTASMNIFKWAHVLPNGVQLLQLVTVSPAVVVLKPMRRHWPVMPHYARKPAWFRLSSRKYS